MKAALEGRKCGGDDGEGRLTDYGKRKAATGRYGKYIHDSFNISMCNYKLLL